VAGFTEDRLLLNELRDFLKGVKDLERLTARLQSGSGQPRDLLAVAGSLERIAPLKQLLNSARASAAELQDLEAKLVELPELHALIERAIDPEPAAMLKDGGVIRSGYHETLDALRAAAGEGRQWLAEYQQKEVERTGIKNLKVRHNKVFGYYLEVSKGNLPLVPETYVRKQTLVNAERFITPELKEYENRIFGAQERAVALEQELFEAVRQAVLRETEGLQQNAAALAALDVLSTFAERALSLGYVRPQMTENDELQITDGRHPVIEQMPGADRFVPNDTLLNCTSDQLMIITGPNMAGKSTYIRQVALIAVMAHMGCFVPAAAAEIGLLDRVFTRVGASDDLARGRSTFMVEMQEAANILNNATPRSLIVLDEIGRGTSTFDGISIAWAVAEFLCNNPAVKAKTLFATHYHELTDLALTVSGVKNCNVLVREHNDQITFLRKIAPGGADKSYGIQVARLAGLPDPVIRRAKEILSNLEEGEFNEGGQPRIARHLPRPRRAHEDQLDLL
jgi:DNA mismatch repair protein MutS